MFTIISESRKLFAGLLVVFTLAGCGGNVESCLEEQTCGPVIEVPKSASALPLDPSDTFWTTDSRFTLVELGPQMITNPKWPDPSIKNVRIAAARDGEDIAICLEWDDPTRDRTFGISSLYIDMAALMFPLSLQGEFPAITMGEPGKMVNIWQWKDPQSPESVRSERAGHVKSKSEFPIVVEDLNAEGYSTLTEQDEQNVQGGSFWNDGKWRIVFKRRMDTGDDNDVQLTGSSLMAVAVWNGANRERNGQKGLVGWLLLKFV
ncbi:MAG: hypothetical protein G3M78_13100 [Candidatus Nitrohelix vancouverensis]|uniref:Cytochrome c-552/DMSO reductase-like haem-binding domain-containing protein n=1 Tax=Candidatus Nitrohelix vancouverensis TaxID=2705534 RepID=A0A7T0C470_9BACT|nr:MAG: hypothetical protein G3M78_13100 [Candidatus Nitrohelix vancouverensis]